MIKIFCWFANANVEKLWLMSFTSKIYRILTTFQVESFSVHLIEFAIKSVIMNFVLNAEA